jgi:hypothetical protein
MNVKEFEKNYRSGPEEEMRQVSISESPYILQKNIVIQCKISAKNADNLDNLSLFYQRWATEIFFDSGIQ